MTTIIRSGFSTLQIYPRTLRRYFSLMSRLTSSTSRSQYFRNVRIRFFHLLPICSSPSLLSSSRPGIPAAHRPGTLSFLTALCGHYRHSILLLAGNASRPQIPLRSLPSPYPALGSFQCSYCCLSWLSSTLRSTVITGQTDRFISVTSSPYIITVPDLD